MEQTVSVIIPVYNVEEYLDQCVESVRHQTYTNLQIILVDDGSKDQSGVKCDQYAESDSRITVIHKENAGLGMARNSGLEAAQGDWIMFIDSDDWIEPEMAERLLTEALREQADMVISGLLKYNQHGGSRRELCCHEKQVFRGEDQIIKNVFYPLIGEDSRDSDNPKKNEISSCINLYASRVIAQHHIRFFSEREIPSEDTFFNMEYVLKCGCIVRIPECMYHYRYNQKSTTHSFRPNRMALYQKMFAQMEFILEQNNLMEGVGHRLERDYMMRVRHALMIASVADVTAAEKRAIFREAVSFPMTEIMVKRYPMKAVPVRENIQAWLMDKKWTIALQGYMRLQVNLVEMRDRFFRRRKS